MKPLIDAKRIRALRMKQDWSQQDLAGESGLAASTIVRPEPAHCQAFHIEGASNDVMLLIEWTNPDSTQKSGESAELQQPLKRSGASLVDLYSLVKVEKGLAQQSVPRPSR